MYISNFKVLILIFFLPQKSKHHVKSEFSYFLLSDDTVLICIFSFPSHSTKLNKKQSFLIKKLCDGYQFFKKVYLYIILIFDVYSCDVRLSIPLFKLFKEIVENNAFYVSVFQISVNVVFVTYEFVERKKRNDVCKFFLL